MWVRVQPKYYLNKLNFEIFTSYIRYNIWQISIKKFYYILIQIAFPCVSTSHNLFNFINIVIWTSILILFSNFLHTNEIRLSVYNYFKYIFFMWKYNKLYENKIYTQSVVIKSVIIIYFIFNLKYTFVIQLIQH